MITVALFFLALGSVVGFFGGMVYAEERNNRRLRAAITAAGLPTRETEAGRREADRATVSPLWLALGAETRARRPPP